MKKVRIGIIGAGRAGMIHANNLKMAGAEIVAFSSRTESTCRACCDSFGIDRYYTDYNDLIAAKDIDAVVIATPTLNHCDAAIKSAAAGKHILCEKPMAMSGDECAKMRLAVEKSGVLMLVMFVRRFDASYRAAKQAVDEGRIGDVVLIKASSRTPGFPKEQAFDIATSRGLLSELSSHDIDAMRWFAGAEFSSIHTVVGNYRSPEQREKYPDYYDNMVTLATFQNGVQGLMDGAFSEQYGYDAKLEILGTKGSIRLGEINRDYVAVFDANGQHRALYRSWKDVYKDAFIEEARHFLACLDGKEELCVTPYDGEMAVRAVDACYRSIAENGIVRL